MNPNQIIALAAAAWGSTPEAVLGKSKIRHHLNARWMAIGLIRDVMVLSHESIGELFGKHAGTSGNAVRTIDGMRKRNDQASQHFLKKFDALRSQITQPPP